MVLAAWRYAPESLPAERRRGGGLSRFVSGIGHVMRIRLFVGFMLTSSFTSFCMFGYVSNSSYVLQEQLGLSAITFSWIFGGNALLSTLLALVNVRLIGRYEPRRLILLGMSLAAVGVIILALSTFAWTLPPHSHLCRLLLHHGGERLHLRQRLRSRPGRGPRTRRDRVCG